MINRSNNETHSNYHVEYMQVTQHWCEKSEDFAGADALITAFTDGWEAHPVVEYEDRHFAGMRSIRVYHIHLSREGDDDVVMPVIHNPYVNKLIVSKGMRLIARNAATAQ